MLKQCFAVPIEEGLILSHAAASAAGQNEAGDGAGDLRALTDMRHSFNMRYPLF
jgi:hypothetical protein